MAAALVRGARPRLAAIARAALGAAALLVASDAPGVVRAAVTVPKPLPATAPCAKAAAHRLDFWLGRWEVRNPSGGLEGTNVIERVLGGCAILEHWTDADGSTGKSLFYFDALGARWKQVWVTDTGQFKEKSERSDFAGGVRFQGEIPRPEGRPLQDRTTLTTLPDGRVRQVIEQSADGGATWRAWEGLYTRMSAETPADPRR
jgi:hypothetical protein